MTLSELNALTPDAAAAALLRCCGSTRWAQQTAACRPFRSETDLTDAADRIWAALGRKDWLEAFAAHPQIGGEAPASEKKSGGSGSGNWSATEQSGMQSADERVTQRLAEANREYFDRFGYIFIVCATGKSAHDMLALLEARLHNTAERELPIAAAEQREITQLRLRKLLNE